jgi:hypothetical protein
MHEGYHDHQYSPENQQAAIKFLDHFNGIPESDSLPPVEELDEKTLQCTRTGQVMLDYQNARSLMDVIRDYYKEGKDRPAVELKQLYYSDLYPGIDSWSVSRYQGASPGQKEIRWQRMGTSQVGTIEIERYLLRHSKYLELPLLYIHKGQGHRPILLWLGQNGKVAAQDWQNVAKYIESGYDIISIDPRGLGETRMHYKAASPDDPALAQVDDDRAYVSPLSGVLADYVYNSLLTGRPYLLQMIEDVEIATGFVRSKINGQAEFSVVGFDDAYTLASAVSETLPHIKLVPQPAARALKWSDLVNERIELWPIQYLLPGGAYVH